MNDYNAKLNALSGKLAGGGIGAVCEMTTEAIDTDRAFSNIILQCCQCKDFPMTSMRGHRVLEASIWCPNCSGEMVRMNCNRTFFDVTKAIKAVTAKWNNKQKECSTPQREGE